MKEFVIVINLDAMKGEEVKGTVDFLIELVGLIAAHGELPSYAVGRITQEDGVKRDTDIVATSVMIVDTEKPS